jgi:hypothetical protein
MHQLPYSHLLLYSAKVTSLRLELGRSTRRPLSPSRRGNLHPRPPNLETLRELLHRHFVRVQYQKLNVFDEHINELVSNLSALEGSGIVDFQPQFFRFTFATTTNLIFGEAIGTLGDDFQEAFSNNLNYASRFVAVRMRLAHFYWLYHTRKFRDACEVVKRYANLFVARALKDKEENGEEAAMERYLLSLIYTKILRTRL